MNSFVIEKQDEEENLIPNIKIVINNDLQMEQLYVAGWKIKQRRWPLVNFKMNSCINILSVFDNISICKGVENQGCFKNHCAYYWDEKKDQICKKYSYFRPNKCHVICSNPAGCCVECEIINNQATKSSEDVPCSTSTVGDKTMMKLFGRDVSTLNEWQILFFQEQIKNAKVDPKGRKFHPDMIRWSIELYARSPAAYHHIRNSDVLFLPSPATISKYRNNFKATPGINEMALEELDRIMEENESLPVYITVDEMKIRENLVYQNGEISGFVLGWETNEIATHIIVFYVRSFKKEVSIPLAWYPTKSTPACQISLKFWKILYELEKRNIHVHAVVADGAATNRKFFKQLSGKKNIPLQGVFSAPNPYNINNPIYLCSDVQHLLKTVRNGLLSSGWSGKRLLNINGECGREIIWKHISDLYSLEKSLPFTRWTRLTQAHMSLNNFSKMKVNLARDTISWKVGRSLRMINGAEATAEFILLFDRWYEIMTCKANNPVDSMDDERITWLRDEFLPKIKMWLQDVRNNHKKESDKRLLPMPTMEGLLFTTNNFIQLAKRLLDLDGMRYVCFGTISQDVLEAFFGNLRQFGRFSQNPDAAQVAYGVQHIVQRKIIKKVKNGNTTYGSTNAWTEVSHVPFKK
uniref:uncharacterized protein LOC101242444 n=1 Tax=Ciona intestinalis TaxID=7719 RepID=UPI000EF5589C